MRLIARMKGEAPSITVAMLVSQLSVDGRGQGISYEVPTCRIPRPNKICQSRLSCRKNLMRMLFDAPYSP